MPERMRSGILRSAISLVALKRDLFRGGYRLRPRGAKFVKEREHAQLALGHVEGGASRVRRLDAMVQVKAFQQLAEGQGSPRCATVPTATMNSQPHLGQVSTDSAGAVASQMPSI